MLSVFPSVNVNVTTINTQAIQLADTNYGKPGPIDILIGADLFWHLIGTGRISYANKDNIWLDNIWSHELQTAKYYVLQY